MPNSNGDWPNFGLIVDKDHQRMSYSYDSHPLYRIRFSTPCLPPCLPSKASMSSLHFFNGSFISPELKNNTINSYFWRYSQWKVINGLVGVDSICFWTNDLGTLWTKQSEVEWSVMSGMEWSYIFYLQDLQLPSKEIFFLVKKTNTKIGGANICLQRIKNHTMENKLKQIFLNKNFYKQHQVGKTSQYKLTSVIS